MMAGKRRRALIGSAIAGLAIIGGALAFHRVAADPLPVPDRYRVTASGRIDAASEARFLVAERDARIAETLVRPGDRIAAGDPLLRLACDDVAAELAAARSSAAAEAAKARLVLAGPRREDRAQADARVAALAARAADADDQLRRAEALRASGFVSGRRLSALAADAAARAADLQVAKAGADAMRNGARVDERAGALASVASARASADALSARLAKCTLRSPVAGLVLKVLRREGEFSGSSTGTPLVVVGDLTRLIVRAEVADRDAANVHLGASAEVWIDGQPQRWHGRVVELAALMGRKTSRSLDPADRFDRDVREVLVAFDQPPGTMPVGLRVNVGVLR